jgi:hypothetical protein
MTSFSNVLITGKLGVKMYFCLERKRVCHTRTRFNERFYALERLHRVRDC